jgi:ribulose-phosphate 3-epimerase
VCPDLRQEVRAIKALGVKAGVSVNPATPIDIIDYILPELDLVLVMSVNPGYAGQKFMDEVVDKIAFVREILDERGLAAELEVDGGITADTAPKAVAAGARVLVAGSAIFNKKESVAEAMARLRASIAGLAG